MASSASGGGATATVARFAANFHLDDLPAGTADRAKLLVLDNLGVALAAAPLSIGHTITRYVESLGGSPQARVWGSGLKTAAPLAALANGTMSSAQDFDAGWHLTTHTVPAAISMAEHTGASGKTVLEAFAAGYEAGARLIEVIDSERANRSGAMAGGWYHVGFVGPIASAVSAGKVLGLNEAQLRQAIGSAAGVAGGVRRSFGTMAKAVQAGNSASQGVQAALIAQSGLGGDPDVLEGPLGLLSALHVPIEHADRTLAKLGSTWELMAGLKIKAIPACNPSHRPIEAAIQLRQQHGFAPEDVERVEADFHPFSLMRDDPADEIGGGFSLPFLVAVALVDGQVGLDQMRDDRVHDPRVRALMARTQPRADRQGIQPDEDSESVIVHLKDGRTLTASVKDSRRVESMADIEAKFRDSAGRTLAPDQVERLLDAVMRLETLPGAADLPLAAAG